MKNRIYFASILVLLAAIGCSGSNLGSGDRSAPDLSNSPNALANGASMDLGHPSGVISPASSVISIPIMVNDFHPLPQNQSGFRGYQFTMRLSKGLKLAPNMNASFKPGSYMTDVPSSGIIQSVSDNGDGTFTFVATLVGDINVCSASEKGILATVDLGTNLSSGSSLEQVDLVPSPQGAVTPSPDIVDCALRMLDVSYGVSSMPVQVSMSEIISWTPSRM